MPAAVNSTNPRPLTFILIGIPGLEDEELWISIPFCLIYVMALLGNSLLLYIIKSDPSFHEPMFFFLSMLAGNDIGMSTSTLPKMLSIFWLNCREINFSACLIQMFFVHSLSVVETGILVAMAYDRYIAICYPLRYTSILTNSLLGKISIIILIRAFITIFPLPFLVNRLQYCNTNIVLHSYCEHMALVKIACGDTRVNNIYGLILSLSITGFDLLFIASSYVMILRAVFHLPSKDARHKAFSTCGAHVCVILITYTPGIFSFLTHRFGQDSVPHHVHIFLANVYLLFPAMLNPLVYGVKTKQIRNRVLKLLSGANSYTWFCVYSLYRS
ncbi:olfactory receptor 52K1-like [Rhinatrema bivittatum]|uniref:olfactory receptor 52K1-like n=1 Tax=Rhinatrema bivittatum TaxID=194408 RepID=UPI001127AAA6|nr:olfactory receptor 52K1-like [Rhinatrema bivittatum]